MFEFKSKSRPPCSLPVKYSFFSTDLTLMMSLDEKLRLEYLCHELIEPLQVKGYVY